MDLSITGNEMATVNIDFVISMFILLVILGSVLSIAGGRLETVEKAEEMIQARSVSEKVASAIEEVYSGGEGHQVEIKMPRDIKGSYYQVNVNQTGVLVEVGGWNAYSYSFQKKISSYNSNQSEVTLLPNRTYTFRNVKEGYSNKVVIF
jgi:hypothetical protein